MSDGLRVFTVFVCLFDVGVLIGLYVRAGRLFLPGVWWRSLFLAWALWLLSGAAGSYDRIGEPLTWRTPVIALAAALEAMSFVGIWHWYGTPRGRKHVEKVLRS